MFTVWMVEADRWCIEGVYEEEWEALATALLLSREGIKAKVGDDLYLLVP